jgi:hypothetical protein
MKFVVTGLLFALLTTTAACGDDSSTTADAAPADAAPAANDSGTDASADGYRPLVTADWSLQPGEEGYICATKVLTEDVYVSAIRPISPTGTHHTTISLVDGATDDPGSPCGPMFGDFYASGVGTGALELPPGVGLVAHAGQALRMNLHLFNTSDNVLSGTSGIEVKTIEPADVQHEAAVTYPGVTSFSVPPNGQPYSATDVDNVSSPRTIFAIFPHMHTLGTHFRTRVLRGGQPLTTIWDDDFQFESQEFAAITPVQVQPGDQIETTCTWVNHTGAAVSWGDSTTAEMCFSIIMSY